MPEEREPLAVMPEKPLTRRAFVKGVLVVAGATGLGWVPLPSVQAVGDATPGAVKPTLYLVATAHNDTQWNWTVQHTIRDCIPATMQPNWALFEKYPDYNFNYEGVIHYMFFKEYHPDQWPQLQEWVRKGRWKLSGSWINAVDVNVPSAESLFRQALYGQQFFRREFGQVSRDIYLPDCFGFPYSLPSIGRHSGLIAFSTQKLSWGGWIDAPFAVGRWEGVDGSQMVASLRPGAYVTKIRTDTAVSPRWTDDFSQAGDRAVDLRYFGTGDQGGTPDEASVQWAQKSIQDTTAPVRVINTSADQLAKDLKPSEIAALPHYKGELVMKTHGVGCYTSQAARKKWNRMNEQMGDAAERASLAAAWLGGPAYPHDTLNAAWLRTLWHQFHDDLPGTCIPQAYTFSWNDDLLSLNQFSQIVTTGVGAIAQRLNTQTQGVPLVVYNPLDQPRRDVVEATVTLPHASPAVRVYDTVTGAEVPSQTLSQNGSTVKLLFQANAPAVGCRVYDVRSSQTACALKTGLSVTNNGLENSRYRVTVSDAGDISSVYDKQAKTELLSEPSTMQQFHDYSPDWPAWEIKWDVTSKPPRGVVNENPRVQIVEHGPARVSLEVTRNLGDSTFVQHIRLTPGGDWVEVHHEVDWQTPGTLVKAAFPMTATNPTATFDLGLGVVERPNAEPNRYEVNCQQWADITDAGGGHGLAVLTNFKYGWDKPTDNTLRLSVIRTPDGGGNWHHQETNDIGHHQFAYAYAGHAGDWRQGQIPQRAARFNQPLCAFQTIRHAGQGGHEFSLLKVSTEQVAVRALKKAEDTDEWVIRLQETHGRPARRVAVSFAAPVISIREINAAEEPIGPYQAQGGKLMFDLTAYQPRSFAVKLAAAPGKIAPVHSTPVALPFDLNGISHHPSLTDGAFQDNGQAYPAELWPKNLTSDGIAFRLGSSAPGAKNMLTCRGQSIALPVGSHNRLYLLAASVGGDQTGPFAIHSSAGKSTHTLRVQDWVQHIGQWDSRLAHPSAGDGGGQIVSEIKGGKVVGLDRLRPAYVKRDPIAWVGSHRHGPDGDQAYLFCYLFQYRLDLPTGATSITLPNNPSIRVMAMTAAQNALGDTRPAGVMYEPELTDATLPKPIALRRPTGPATAVYRLDAVQTLDGTTAGPTQVDITGLPTEADAPWTINLWAYMDTPPDTRTLLAGFGDATDTSGTQRYLGRITGGIHFWGSNVDIETGQPFDIGKWQMLTAVYDGATVSVYKNGEKLISAPADLNEAAPVVQIAPKGPWGGGQRFAGKLQGVTIWNGALDAAALHALLAARPQG
ncbi:MAG: glycosyl hydrolase-related protein [Armatimonadota bacterium]|nr:glycosyl hydrolase-related protein [Armatimonadota bacterium]